MVPLEQSITDTVAGSLTIMLEGVEQGAVDAGLSRETARAFASQALLGSALLLQDPTLSPASLKDRVASPGGTTIAGLAVLEDHGVRGTLLRSVQTTASSSEEGGDR